MPSFVQRFNDATGRKRVSARVRSAVEKAPTPPNAGLAVYRSHAWTYADRVQALANAELSREFPNWAELEDRINKIPIRGAARTAGRRAQTHAATEMGRSLGKPVSRDKPGDKAVLDAFVNHQEQSFRKLAADQVNAMRIAALSGKDPRETLWISRNRSILIAGDETHRIFAESQSFYGLRNGSDSFVWVTRADERVREGHARLHNTVQKWSQPPNTGRLEGNNLPGQAVHCRCIAAPLPNVAEVVERPEPRIIVRRPPTPKPAAVTPKPAMPRIPVDGLHLTKENAAEISTLRQQVRDDVAKNGIKLGKEGPPFGDGRLLPADPQVVDLHMQRHGLEDAHKAWLGQGPAEQGWYVESTNANGSLGKWLNSSPPASDLQILKAETGFAGTAKDLERMAKTQYAATQEVISQRLAKGGITGVDKDGYVTLYRGISPKQGKSLREALESDGEADLQVRSLSSWTTDSNVAETFSQGRANGGEVIEKKVHVSRVFAQWENSDFSSRVYGEEREWVVIEPTEKIRLNKSNLFFQKDEM